MRIRQRENDQQSHESPPIKRRQLALGSFRHPHERKRWTWCHISQAKMNHILTAGKSLYPDDPFDNFFLLGNPPFNSNTQPKQAGYNLPSVTTVRDQGVAYSSSEATPNSSYNFGTAFDTLDSRREGSYYEFSSVAQSPPYGENGLCGALDLAAGNGISSAPKDIVLDACLAQGIHTGGRAARATMEPIKRVRRVRANDRERKRMKSLNRALESLKKCIPVPQSKRRVTKLEVLRIACSYIRSLSETLSDESDSNTGLRNLGGSNTVVNGFSVAQRLEILSGSGAPRI